MPRFHCPIPLASGQTVDLPASAARHVQVLRMQPGMALTLFNGEGGEFEATVLRMGRSDVQVSVGTHHARECEPARAVHLAVGMPANDRMDWLVEKATELGVASIQPLMTAHSVLRLKGERAEKKQAHWQAIAVSACEQCGGNRVPLIHPVRELADWLGQPDRATETTRLILSLGEGTQPLAQALGSGTTTTTPVVFLSGPEGGLSPAEDAQARTAGWQPVTLGGRILRAETAALAALVQATT
jgi:16S rRNA (uracil1498-N3)-methyltransferase